VKAAPSGHHGHATVSITLDTYSHAIPAMQEEAAALIAGLVFAEQERATVREFVRPGARVAHLPKTGCWC